MRYVRPLDPIRCAELVASDRWKFEVAGSCWIWKRAIAANGYGKTHLLNKDFYTHRIAWVAAHGIDVPSGLIVDHLCHNDAAECVGGWQCLHRRCVNPDHLEAVPQRTNLLRGNTIYARNASATHCPKGHSNWATRSNGKRWCRDCNIEWKRRRRN